MNPDCITKFQVFSTRGFDAERLENRPEADITGPCIRSTLYLPEIVKPRRGFLLS